LIGENLKKPNQAEELFQLTEQEFNLSKFNVKKSHFGWKLISCTAEKES